MRYTPICRPSALAISLLVAAATLLPLGPPASAALKRPKLVVVLVVDQFRADYLQRFESRFAPASGKGGDVGGFNYLMRQGAYFPMAEYGLLASMTCPGHATVLTGAYPYQMGIPINYWFNARKGEHVYCAEDSAFPTVGAPHRDHSGTAPTLLNGTTVGDELKNAGLPSRVISLALKDRSAIMLGGKRADLSFWMHGKERAWVSSKFYLPDGKLPAWLEALNREIAPRPGQKIRWEAQGKPTGLSDANYSPALDVAGIGRRFPHEVAASEKGALALPYGMELTVQAAERAIDEYKLGQGAGPDVLAVSLSSHDYVGHAFGPNSREMEEMTVIEDRLVARLLNHVRKRVPGGLDQVVTVLTGDHGAPPDPSWAKARGIDAGMISEKTLTEEVEKTLNEKFGKPGEGSWIGMNHDLNIFINRKAAEDRKAPIADVLEAIKQKLRANPGVAHAFTSLDYEARKLPPKLLGEQALQTYVPGRSGDVVIIAKPFWMIEDDDTVTHLTGYSYDRMVPLAIAGFGIRPGIHRGHVKVNDIAPTLSALLSVLPPSLSEGRVLTEALKPEGGR